MKLTKLRSHSPINVAVKGDIDWEKRVSKPQKLVKDFLYPYWKFDQVTEEFVIPGSIFRADLFNITKRIIVEVSPDEYHVNYNPWLHKDKFKFIAKIKADQEKRDWCERNKIRLIELYNEDLKNLSATYISEKYEIDL